MYARKKPAQLASGWQCARSTLRLAPLLARSVAPFAGAGSVQEDPPRDEVAEGQPGHDTLLGLGKVMSASMKLGRQGKTV